MPLMTKIRDNMATVFPIIAGFFVVLIVADWGFDLSGRRHAKMENQSQEIGVVNGEVMSTKEFTELVRQTADNQKAQTGTEPDDNQMRSIRDAAWNQMVENRLYGEQVRRFGITVPDKEMVDWLLGENPPDFLKRQFTDSTGNFNRVAYEQALKDPRNKQKLVTLEQALKTQREREKLQSVLLASVQVSESDVLQKFIDQNVKYDADYALFNPDVLVKDDEV